MNVKGIEKKDTKIAILLIPDELQKTFTPLQSLHIEKSAKGIDYSIVPFNRREITQYYIHLTEAARSALLLLGPEALDNIRQEAEQRYKKQKAGVPLATLTAASLNRHLHQQLQKLIPSLSGARLYHKIRRPGSKTFQNHPCTFSHERPRLGFDVGKEGERFLVHITVETAGVSESIKEFTRTGFLIEKNHSYHLLSFADYQTLEWLEQESVQQASLDEKSFAENVLARLEKDYSVNRQHYFAEQQVKVQPTCRVLLTELNNAFLLLTPQFLYDGFVVDGPFREKEKVTVGGHRIVIARQKESEQTFLSQLSCLHSKFESQLNGYYYLSFAEAQKKGWFIQTIYHLMEKEVEVTGMDMLQHFKYSPHKAETAVKILQEDNRVLRLHVTVTFGKETVTLALLQKTLWAGQRAVVLRDGSMGILSDDWMSRYAILVKHGKVNGAELEASRFLGLPDGIAQEGNDGLTSFRKEWWEKWKLWQDGDGPLYPTPNTIKASLRPYQRKGFEWLALLAEIGSGGCLADDMGLGKTLQTICFLAHYSELYPLARHLIVCPTSLIYNWQRELEKFAPALSVEVYYGAARCESTTFSNQVIITSYGTLRNSPELFNSEKFGVAVLDESHYIKNPAAQITRTVSTLEASIRVSLSGTPVVNNTFDLYSQLSFAVPSLLGSREFFKREYADPIDRWGDEAKIKALGRLTAPFVLRRTKEQVAPDLPSKTESVLWCTMSPAQQELYDEIREQVRGNLFMDIKQSGLNKAKLAVLQGLLKLRQVCNDPLLLTVEEHGGRTQSIKTETLLEELENVLDTRKVLVFSQFTSMLHLLAQHCTKRDIAYYLLDGSTPAEKRAQMADDFQQNEAAPRLFFISLKAGGTGMTLTAADYVFLFDPWWNRAVEQQAVDRTHRIGQTKKVFAYKMVCRNSVEERILELQARKSHLAEELVNEEGFVQTLTEEDIAYLFT